MQFTNSILGLRRPFIHSLAAMAVVASAVLSTGADAQGNPPRPPRAGRGGDSVGPRPMNPPAVRGRVGPGMGGEVGPGMARGMGQGMGPGDMGPGNRGRRGGKAGRGNAGRANRNPASAFLRMRQQLALTDDQVKRLEALQAAPVPQRNQSDMLRAQADLMDATRGDGNISAARAALERMSRVRTEQTLAGLKARQDARNVLTATQKSKIDNMRGEMRGNLRGKMRGEQRDRARGANRGMQRGGRPGDMGQGFAPRRQPGMRQGGQPPMPPMAPMRRRRGDEQR